MNYYIKGIHINRLHHLHDMDIRPVGKDAPHLLLTGRNGSGKTVLLNAVADFLERMREGMNREGDEALTEYYRTQLHRYTPGQSEYISAEKQYSRYQRNADELYGRVELDFGGDYDFIHDYAAGNFVIAFYPAFRQLTIDEPRNPAKTDMTQSNTGVRSNSTSRLLNFLAALKIQEALARNEGERAEADSIKDWFAGFEKMLSLIFENASLKLSFHYRDYSFSIHTGDRQFGFTELSAGFAAVTDIVADLMLKMQSGDSPTLFFRKGGIVLIDEIETHLHLSLQKLILPTLTELFPNVQFICSTHSPFVVNSHPGVTAFDLEHREAIPDLSKYSMQALTEGYFRVGGDSHYAAMRLHRLEELLKTGCAEGAGMAEARCIMTEFEKIPEMFAPSLLARYRRLLIDRSDLVKRIWND